MSHQWPIVPLRDVLLPVERLTTPVPGVLYRQIGVRLWGGGVYERPLMDGGNTQYKTLSRVDADDIVVNKIWARNGSVGVVPSEMADCYVSSEFPTFDPVRDRLDPTWFHWITKTKQFWQQCDEKSRGSSGKNRIRQEQFLNVTIPLPDVYEQQRLVGVISDIDNKLHRSRGFRRSSRGSMSRLLLSAFSKIVMDAPRLSMLEVAPLQRRPVAVDPEGQYRELGIRSFGKGTFHKPTLTGLEIGTKRIFSIEPGDLLFGIVFAWEGAVAVARPEDSGRVGSHRFLTCVVNPEMATAQFLRFHFSTKDGLEQLGHASPGGAGRNRTLGLSALNKIMVPVPTLEQQQWFDRLQAKVAAVSELGASTDEKFSLLMASVLDRAIQGVL